MKARCSTLSGEHVVRTTTRSEPGGLIATPVGLAVDGQKRRASATRKELGASLPQGESRSRRVRHSLHDGAARTDERGEMPRGVSLRWQIELQFKRWKSLCGFDRLPNYRDDTIVAWLYAKVLLGRARPIGWLLPRRAFPRRLLAPIERAPRLPGRRCRRGALLKQPWKLTSVLYPLMLAAILPLSLRSALERLPQLTARLEPPAHEIAQLQLPLFRGGLRRRAKRRSALWLLLLTAMPLFPSPDFRGRGARRSTRSSPSLPPEIGGKGRGWGADTENRRSSARAERGRPTSEPPSPTGTPPCSWM